MKLGLKTVFFAIALIGLIAVSAWSMPAIISGQQIVTQNNIIDPFHQDIKYQGYVEVYKIPAGSDTPELITANHNLLVDNGKTYIRTQIGSGGASASSSAKYISLSNSATAPDAAWVDIPSEITTNGLGRASATYAANGTGAWNMTYTWTATGNQSAQLTGLSYGGTPADNTLFAALAMPSVSLLTNDQLRVIWSISVS